MDLVRCDDLEFVGQDTPGQTVWFDQFLPAETGDGAPDEQVYWEHYWTGSTTGIPPAAIPTAAATCEA